MITDDCHRSRVDTKDGIICLKVASEAFRDLFASYREVLFREARAAAAVLSQQLNLDPTDKVAFRRHLDEAKTDGSHTPSVEKSFELFRQGMIAAEAIGVNDAAEFWIPDAASLDFGGLQRLVYASIEARRQK